MNTQQIIEQALEISNGFSKNIIELFDLIVRARDLLLNGDIRDDRYIVLAMVSRIQEAAEAEFTTYKEILLKINPHFRERTFGLSNKRKQEIQTYIDNITVSIANITDLKQEINEIIDRIRPYVDDDGDDDDDDDEQNYSGDSSSSTSRLSAGGGKKSKKRRRQSKQTKQRQHKINKQSKLKYTIRRR